MLKKFEMNEYKYCKTTTINIDCGLLDNGKKNDFIKKLVDLIESCEDYCANKEDK